MKPIFGKAPPLGIRLALAVIASMTLILVAVSYTHLRAHETS